MTTQRQRISIPDDWEGGEWACVQIEWPNSVEWLAILRGFISSPAAGRFWDQDTGSVKGAQSVGYEIISKNQPLVTCGGVAIENGNIAAEREIVYIPVRDDESEENMGWLCGVNPSAFKVENGALYVKDFCGEWHEVGSVVGGASGSPTIPDLPGYDPGNGLDSGTACAKATKLAEMTYTIVQAGFGSIDLEDTIWGWYDFATNVRQAVQGVNLGDSELYNMYASVYALSVAGYENETENPSIVTMLKCSWAKALEDGGAGVTSDQYDECKYLLSQVVRQAFPSGSAYGFEDEQRRVWERAFASIGKGDVEKITTGLVPNGDEDCDCPGIDPTLVWENEEDWRVELNFQGALPSYVTLNSDNGQTYVTAQGLALYEDTVGSDKVGFSWSPPVTTGTVHRVRVEMLINDTWIAADPWVGLGFALCGLNNQEDGIIGTGGVYVWENTEMGFTPAITYVVAEANADDTKTPMHVVIARVVLAGSGAHPLGL